MAYAPPIPPPPPPAPAGSDIHYFPRYHQRENVVTNHSLLLLSRVYEHSFRHFEAVLETLLPKNVEATLPIGPRFSQQIGGKGTVPDGSISQTGFQVLIETKLGGNPSVAQLRGHAKRFSQKTNRVLLLLDKEPMSNEQSEVLRKELQADGITFAAVTFADLIDAVRGAIGEYDLEMQALVNDFDNFIQEEGLLPNTYHTMHAVPTGWSFDVNFQYGLYFDPPNRGHRARTYLGLYQLKKVKAIGLIDQVVVINWDRQSDTLDISDQPRGEPLTNEEVARIRGCIDAFNWESLDGLRFTLVKDRFVETRFRKDSKGGMMRARYFNLYEEIGEEKWDKAWHQPDLAHLPAIAAALNEKTWS